MTASMLDAFVHIAAPLSMLVTISMAAFLFYCLCGCKAKERKEEFDGIEGHVKMHNIETENEVSSNSVPVVDTANSAKRSLPDLPVDSAGWEPNGNGDGASELYATVGKVPDKREAETAIQSLRLDHPYDKVRRVEHPYAQVTVASTSQEMTASSGHIAAATAIAGQVPASDDLPYVTPPPHFSGDSQDSAKGYTSISVREPLSEILAESRRVGAARTASDYATLSDDSDDMYAAIEEPTSGSETYAQIAQPPTVLPPVHLHPRQESNLSGASSSAVNSPKPDKREAKSPLPPPPAPPSPDLLAPPTLDDMYAKVNKKRRREIDDTMTRGPSTESGSSESVSYKLQSNSTSTDTNSCHSHPTTESSTSSAVSKSHACCESHSTTSNSPPTRPQDGTDSSLSSDGENHGSYERLDPPYETLSSKRRINAQTSLEGDPDYEPLGGKLATNDPGYETLSSRLNTCNPDYETLGASKKADPGYETLGGDREDAIVEPCYETLENQSLPGGNDPGYETLGSRFRREHRYEPLRSNYESLPNGTNDPTYETLGRGSDSDPNYERIGVPHEDGYALVVKRRHGDYETVHFEQPYTSLGSGEPPYSSLDGVEPPYSSLNPVDPPYTSLKPLDSPSDPPYQRLADFGSGVVDK